MKAKISIQYFCPDKEVSSEMDLEVDDFHIELNQKVDPVYVRDEDGLAGYEIGDKFVSITGTIKRNTKFVGVEDEFSKEI